MSETSLLIRRARVGDAETICEIRDKAWLEAYPNVELGITIEDVRLNAQGKGGVFVPKRIAYLKEQFAKDDEGQNTFVAELDGRVVGYIDPRIDEDNRRNVGSIYVHTEAQGIGVGSKLMNKVLDFYGRNQDIFLQVVSYNQNAIDFYKKFGFEKTNGTVKEESGRPSYMKSIPEIEMVRRPRD